MWELNWSKWEDLIIDTCSKEKLDLYLKKRWYQEFGNYSSNGQGYGLNIFNVLDKQKIDNSIKSSQVLKLTSYIMKTGEYTAEILWYHFNNLVLQEEWIIWNKHNTGEKITGKIENEIIILFDTTHKYSDPSLIEDLIEIKK